ncbi:MAG: DUF438 domain-containing protein [Clostridiales bacterium]|nr:DUF438 domain-containing protein [Clostridiales bacterium]
MSEQINNREYRQKVLKEIILELHDGKTVEEVQDRFAKLIEGISATEISMMENQLIMEGLPVSEVQRLCDVHAAVFKGSIEEIHMPDNPAEIPGHPVHTFKMENRGIEGHIDKKVKPLLSKLLENDEKDTRTALIKELEKLYELDKHYSRKENLIFPYLEKYGVTGPPQVMWGVDDEIREDIKNLKSFINDNNDAKEISSKAETIITSVEEMIFKEENILFPMALDTLNEDEWLVIAKESQEIGYCFYEPKKEWKPARVNLKEKAENDGEKIIGESPIGGGYINFETGLLKANELEGMLNAMPVDITFVDKDGIVKYFSQGKERIFPRTKAVIGRTVSNCHPPASVHVVEKIVEDLMSGKKDHEDFWIRMGDRYTLIRYFAVRDKDGNYLGTLEFTQDIAPIQAIEGEKRLLSD